MDWSKHQILETSSFLLLIGILVTVAIGGFLALGHLFQFSGHDSVSASLCSHQPNLSDRAAERVCSYGPQNLVSLHSQILTLR